MSCYQEVMSVDFEIYGERTIWLSYVGSIDERKILCLGSNKKVGINDWFVNFMT